MTVHESLLKNNGPEAIETKCRHSLERLLREIHSPSSLDEIWPIFQDNSVYQDMIENWPLWAETYRERRWEAVCRELEKTAYATRPYCLGCGDCCRQGSPTLYIDDRPILHKGIIKRFELVTLRAGEIGFSNATQDLVLLPEERIKIKEKPGSRECHFLASETNKCRIYQDRPLQCRIMECWNPENFQSLEAQTFLSRKDLLNPDDPIIPIIESHAKRCAVDDLQKVLTRAKRGFADAEEEALDILFFDEHLRGHLEEEQGIKRENQLFLFGRPIADLITSFGFRLEETQEGKIRLTLDVQS